MPSLLAHAAPVLALAPVFPSRRLWVLGALCAAAPDLDVIGLALGVPYGHWLGHRGLSHSIPFAALVAACVTGLAFPRGQPGLPRFRAWLFLFFATTSHGVLDAFTDGGLGVALLSPFDERRFFAPFRPIEVSPLGVGAFFSARGLTVLTSELAWIGLPSLLLGLLLWWRAR